jgi:hypothetical protein
MAGGETRAAGTGPRIARLAIVALAVCALVAAAPVTGSAAPSGDATAAAKKCKKKKGAKKKKCKKRAPSPGPTTPTPPTPTPTPPPVTGNPALAVTPASVDFGPAPVNVSTGNFPFTIVNTGTATSTIDVALTGSPRFTLVSDTCGTHAPGDGCFATIEFTPNTIGAPQAATLTATTPGASDSASLAGDGSGGVAVLSMTPDPLDFGTVPIGQASADQFFTITNTGTATTGELSFGDAGGPNPNDFVQLGSLNNCAGDALPTARLLPGQSCTFGLFFQPFPGPLGVRTNNWGVDETPGAATDTATMTGTAS